VHFTNVTFSYETIVDLRDISLLYNLPL